MPTQYANDSYNTLPIRNQTPRNNNNTKLPKSLPLLLARRLEGALPTRQSFASGVLQHLTPACLVQNPQIWTSNATTISTTTASVAINSIHVDRVESRFVLSGGNDAIVSVYDLSKWGSDAYLEQRNAGAGTARRRQHPAVNPQQSLHKPIASSQREAPTRASTNQNARLTIPSGHSSPISKVQWYPVDSGAFISSSKDGSLLVWDTDSMAPVAQCTPFETKGIAAFHISSRRQYSAVVASLYDPSLKLVDIRTGASSHTLLGHGHPGISSVQWAPHTDIIVASGGLDGTARLWDIRKAGGRACVAIMNQDKTQPRRIAKAYHADYSHLPKPAIGKIPSSLLLQDNTNEGSIMNRAATTRQQQQPSHHLAPNNYRLSENTIVKSHSGGSISALSFTAASDGHYLVTAGQDGNLHIWDLRGNGHLLPLRFLAPNKQPAVSPQRKQIPMLLTTANNIYCWIGNGSNLLGYSLEGGGIPKTVLKGHLHTITAVDAIEASMQLLTAGKDGMILTWGRQQNSTTTTSSKKRQKVDEDSW